MLVPMSYISFYEAAWAKDQAHRSAVAPRDQLSEILGTRLKAPEPLSASTVWGITSTIEFEVAPNTKQPEYEALP